MLTFSFAVAAALVAFVASLPRISSALGESLATFEISKRLLLVAAGGSMALATYLRLVPLCFSPPPFAADIERLYRIAAFSSWDHLFDPQDYHHPGLWFALLHWPFAASGYSHLVPAALGRLCAVLVVPVTGALVARYAGRLAAAVAMLNVAILPFLTVQARAQADVTLFMLLGTLALWLFALVRERATFVRVAALITALTLALNASYSAPVLVAALSLDAVLQRRGRGVLVAAVSAVWILGAPRWVHLVRLLPFEFGIRSTIATLGVQHWANVAAHDLVLEAATDYLTSAFPWVLVVLLAALWSGRTLLRNQITEVGWSLFAYLVFLGSFPFLRMRPYYASLLPVLLLVRLAALAAPRQEGEEVYTASRRRGMALLASLACSLAYAVAIATQVPNVDENAERNLVQVALADGATRLASTNWTETTWYFFDDPIGTMVPCIVAPPASHCGSMQGYTEEAASQRRFYRLENGLLADNPQGLVSALQQVEADGVVHVLLSLVSPFDVALLEHARTHCTKLSQAGTWEMWRCPGAV